MSTVSQLPQTVPVGRTARRLPWPHLPPALRGRIEERCGSPVVSARSQDAGYTPGFASVLECADGSLHFVKAASATAQPAFAASYREEARILAALPDGVPAAGLRWLVDDDWVVLGIEHVTGRSPRRPWSADDLDASLAALHRVVEVLTPAPGTLALTGASDEFGSWPGLWEQAAARPAGLGLVDPARIDEAQALATAALEVVGGDTVVHADVRDDNVLLRPDGTAVLCDWNWPVVGAPWLDTVMLLVGPRGDGVDVEAVLREDPVTRDVPADHVDAALALLAGYFAKSAGDPVPGNSPWLRAHQSWSRDVVWQWLAERRSWT